MLFAPPDQNLAHEVPAGRLQASTPGKTAPRLIHDALLFDPAAKKLTFDLLADPAPIFDGSRPLTSSIAVDACPRHDYALNISRTSLPPRDYRPTAGDHFGAQAVCRKCRVHLSMNIVYPSDGRNCCPNAIRPLHHFILKDASRGSRYTFQCSSPECRAAATFIYHPPVIHESDIDLLVKPDYLQKRYNNAVAKDSSRVGFVLATPVSTLWKLRRYIRDSLKQDSAGKKIPVENKRFLESFGSDCDEIFRRLGFVYMEENGLDASWALPNTSESKSRLFLENWDMELQALIEAFAARDGDLNPCTDYMWFAARSEMERILSAYSYAKSPQSRREENGAIQDHPYYASLGAMRDFSDDNILFAYERQSDCNPENGPYYFDCLQDLANGRESESLTLKASILESEGVVGRKAIQEAYHYLGFDPNTAISDYTIIDRYRSRMQDTGPSAQPALRSMLKCLAFARQSVALSDAANDTIDTYDQALSWLGAVSNYPDESILTLFTTKVADDASTEALAQRAVKVIADHRNSEYLRRWLSTGETQESGMGVDEACRHLKIQLDTVDESMLQLVFEAARSDNPGWKTDQAIETVMKAYKRPKQEPRHAPESWPVGLTSHGNTCYLNSLLQYYFTIKPLRELVAHFDDHKFDLSTHGGKDERVGSRKVTPLEIRAYQKFVEDLKHLFERMIRDPGPAVKPEADLVCRAFLKAEETETQTASQSRAQSPPADISIEQPKPRHHMTQIGDMEVSSSQASSVTLAENDIRIAHTSSRRDELPPSPPTSLPDTDKTMDDSNSLNLPPLPPRQISTPIRQQTNLNKAEEAARQQQDVTEVMDEILFRLRCAIKPDGMDAREEQLDKLRDIFYMKISEKTLDEAGKVVTREEYALNILLNIPSRPTDIYSALGEVFELQTIDHGDRKLKQYKTLQSVPPLLQINIPRNTYDRKTGRGVKVEHKVHLEETLYLDRYFEWETSEIQQRREESWQWRQQLSVLEAQRDVINRNAKTEMEGPVKLQTLAKYVKNLEQSNSALESLGLSPIEFEASMIDNLDSMAAAMQAQLAAIDEQIVALQNNISSSFGGHKELKYRLHSVFFHRGGYGHGHYWTCIYDFQHSIWRIYNDEKVDELTNVNDIFDAETWQQGTPTYAVYVRDNVKDEYVQSVCRHPETYVQEVEKPQDEAVDEVMQDVQGPPPLPPNHPPPKPFHGDHQQPDQNRDVVW